MQRESFCPHGHECSWKDSCTKYGGCEKREHVVVRSTDDWESEDVRKKVALFARKAEKRLLHRARKGSPVIGGTKEDLVQNAWLSLLAGEPPWSLDKPLEEYFVDRRDVERNRIRRLFENDSKRSIARYDIQDERTMSGVSDFVKYKNTRLEEEGHMELLELYEMIVARDKTLAPLLNLYFEHGPLSAKEQARLLSSTPAQVYISRKRLKYIIMEIKLRSKRGGA